MTAADNKRKALDIALASILKTHGEGAVMRLGEAKHLNVDVIPTGRPRVVGQDHDLPACGSPGPEARRDRCIHRHGTCARPGLRSPLRGKRG
jgi:hypothetical protein